jgi:hypothetical protein
MSWVSSFIKKKTGIPEINLQGDALVEAIVSSILKMPVEDVQKIRVVVDKALIDKKPL